jgi:hypothetical protein
MIPPATAYAIALLRKTDPKRADDLERVYRVVKTLEKAK